MGSHLVNGVLNGLAGRELSRPWKKSKNGKTTTKTFGANEIAFLSVIANEQPNPGVNGIADTICYGDVATLNEKMHLSESCFFETRNFLIELGLLNFSKTERHVDVRHGYGKQLYSNVYRISLKAIRALFDAEDDAVWCKQILRMSDSELNNLTIEQKTAFCIGEPAILPKRKLHQAEPALHQAEPKLHKVESKLHKVDTNIYIQEKTDNNNSEGLGVVVLKGIARKIADACNAQEDVVKLPILRQALKGKDISKIDAIISKFINDCNDNPTIWKKPAGARVAILVSQFKYLPAKGSTPAPIDPKQFAAAESVTKPTNQQKVDPAETEWTKLAKEFKMSELSESDFADLRNYFMDVVHRRKDQLPYIIDEIKYSFAHAADESKDISQVKVREEIFRESILNHDR